MTKAAADAGYSAELESDPPEPEPAPGTQLTDQPTPGDTPTGVKVTYTLRTSQVLYLMEHLNSLFTLLNSIRQTGN